MQIIGWLCLLLVACSVLELYKWILGILLGMLIMDFVSCFKFLTQRAEFGWGFLVFGRFSLVFRVLGLIFVLGFGLKVLQFGFHRKGFMQYLCDFRGKSSNLGSGIRSNRCLDDVCDEKIRASQRCSMKFSEKVAPHDDLANGSIDFEVRNGADEELDEKGFCPEDEEFDVLALRKLVKFERKRAKRACRELEKERMAAASAADEAMAMILRLQSEKSSMEIEANQYRRMAEQKQEFDQEVIESMQWIITEHESERSLLEDKLRLCRQRLKICTKGEELDQLEEIDAGSSFLSSNLEDVAENGAISSTEMDL